MSPASPSFFVSRIDSAVDKQLDEKIARANDPSEKERLAALKGKVAIANAKLAYQEYKRLFSGAALGEARGQGRQAAAAAVGFHRHQEQGLQRRPLCRGADRPQHRQHRAAGDARCVPRPRQAARQPRGKCRRRAARARRARKIRHLARCDHGRTGQGRRQAVRRRRRQALRRGRAQARHRRSAAASTRRSSRSATASRRRSRRAPRNGAPRPKSESSGTRTNRSGPVTTRTNGWAGSTARPRPTSPTTRILRGA